jgi:hypothetical protein
MQTFLPGTLAVLSSPAATANIIHEKEVTTNNLPRLLKELYEDNIEDKDTAIGVALRHRTSCRLCQPPR